LPLVFCASIPCDSRALAFTEFAFRNKDASWTALLLSPCTMRVGIVESGPNKHEISCRELPTSKPKVDNTTHFTSSLHKFFIYSLRLKTYLESTVSSSPSTTLRKNLSVIRKRAPKNAAGSYAADFLGLKPKNFTGTPSCIGHGLSSPMLLVEVHVILQISKYSTTLLFHYGSSCTVM
jgi:hypothetical protein